MNAKIITDYSKAEHWLVLPVSIEKEVDVFYLYPTAWQKINKEETSNNCFNSTTLLSRFFTVAALGKNRAKIMCWQLEMNLLPVVY